VRQPPNLINPKLKGIISVMTQLDSYLMENMEEAIRLDIKTDPDAVRKQASFCGLAPGMRVLDAGCGAGRITSILHEMIQPGGEIIGIDYSEKRISYAKEHFGNKPGIDFQVHNLMGSLDNLGQFDLIWNRFFLEYFQKESRDIVSNLSSILKPGGTLCLLDLDYNCLSHYELPNEIEDLLYKIIERLELEHNFDPYAGRKLYSYLFDLGYKDIRLELMAHHLLYGKIREEDVFNWAKKIEVISKKVEDVFSEYPGGCQAFLKSYYSFFQNPRRFTYTPLIICRGSKPSSS